MASTLADIIAVLDAAYPPALAEPWDTGIGLTCGDPEQQVSSVLLAVDVDPVTVAEALELGAQVLVTHHPLLFRPVQSVAVGSDKGDLVSRLIRGQVAHFAAHTNADRAAGGVNDALADRLGLRDTVPLVPVERDRLAGGDDAAGPPTVGLGRVGKLDASVSLRDFTAFVAAALPATACGVSAAGDPDRVVRTVAVCGGAGAGELTAATEAGADVYVTSDLSHHVVAEHCARPTAPAVVRVAHWAGEWPWLERAAEVIRQGTGGSVSVTVSARVTDPWTIHAPSTPTEGAPDRAER